MLRIHDFVVEFSNFDSTASSQLTTQGGLISFDMSVTEVISSEYLGFLIRDLDGPATAPEGTITWGHEYSFSRTLDSDALYTSNAGSAFQTEYYDATTNESLESSSVFTQTFAGTPVGMISGVETYHRTYAGGYSIAFLMYGGMQSWNYGGTDSWTWEDPGLSTFDPELLEEVPMRPLAAPQAAPHAFAVPSATKAVWMPPAIIEDPDAAAAEEGEGITIEGILWGLIPGSSLYDAYQNWKKGEYFSAGLNGFMGGWDFATMGAVGKGKALIKSGVRAIFGGVKQTAKNTKNLYGDVVRLVRGNIDNAGKGLVDDAAGGAKVCRIDAEGNKIIGCFAAGTPILTPFGAKSIEEIAAGDWVLAQDESDPEAVPQPRVVEEIFRNLAQMMTLRVGGHTIATTPEHPFWVRGRGWTPAEEIEPGDELRSHDGQWIALDAKEFSEALIQVFNMRVAEDHTYFVGSPLWGYSVWAHNTYPDPSDQRKIRLSAHAKLRDEQGRPVGKVVNDIQRSGNGDIFMEGSNFVVRGPESREHIISSKGLVMTTLVRTKAALRKRIQSGKIRRATPEEIEALKNMI